MHRIVIIYITISVFLGSLASLHYKPIPLQSSVFSWSEDQVASTGKSDLYELTDVLGISSVYQYFGSKTYGTYDMKSFISGFSVKDKDVYYLTGNPFWALEGRSKSMNAELDKIYDYNRLVPDDQKLNGVIFDVEPYLNDQWDTDKNYVMNRYLYNMKRTYSYAQELGIYMIICIPYWFDNNYHSILESLVSSACDEIAVMNYYRNREIANIENEVVLAEKYDKRITCIIEMQEPVSNELTDANTYYEMGFAVIWRVWRQISYHFKYEGLTFSYHYYKPLFRCFSRLKASILPIYIYKPAFPKNRSELY